MKLENDLFSGYKIYPSKGRLYVRGDSKVFRFMNVNSESLFLQRKNPRRIAWTQLYRRAHKKGLNEETAKKRSRRTVKHQRGIVGADLSAIAALRNQSAAARTQQRQVAIEKAKADKKEKEAKKEKTKVRLTHRLILWTCPNILAGPPERAIRAQGVKTTDEGRKGRSLSVFSLLFLSYMCMHYHALMLHPHAFSFAHKKAHAKLEFAN